MHVAVSKVYLKNIESGFISCFGRMLLGREKYVKGLKILLDFFVKVILLDRVNLAVDATAPNFWKKLHI